MKMKRFAFLTLLAIAALSVCLVASPTSAQTDSGKTDAGLSALEKAKLKLAKQQKYLLRHKLKKGAVLRWQVEHVASTETKVKGNSQTSQSKSGSVKCWRVTAVDEKGNITFSHTVESVNMWSKVGERAEVRYNSQTDKEAPVGYEGVASTIGVTLSTYTIDPQGRVIKRESPHKELSFGVGQMTIPFPAIAAGINDTWNAPSEVQVRLSDKSVKTIKCRQVYKLEAVSGNIATIGLKTEVLTPIGDPQVKAQVVQQLTTGKIRFDMEQGFVVSKSINWDETIVGFGGQDSVLQYLARFTEKPYVATAGPAPSPVRSANVDPINDGTTSILERPAATTAAKPEETEKPAAETATLPKEVRTKPAGPSLIGPQLSGPDKKELPAANVADADPDGVTPK